VEVRIFIVTAAALAAASCGGTHTNSTAGYEDPGGSSDGFSRDGFEIMENLRDNPIDPLSARSESFLSLPGFPRRLADRIIEIRRGGIGRRGLVGRLTPPERDMLYRYSEFIDLPEMKTVDLSVDLMVMEPGGDREREECRIKTGGGAWKSLFRIRRQNGCYPCTAYMSAGVFKGAVRLHTGDFLPDFAMGLLFDSSTFSYLLSVGYIMRSYRWISARTSFYGIHIRGAAVEVWYKRLRTLAFLGRRRAYDSCRFILDAGPVGGARLEYATDAVHAGLTIYREKTGDTSLLSLDARLRAGGVLFGAEASLGIDCGPGFIWGMTFDGDGRSGGVRLYVTPEGLRNRYCGLPGGETGSNSARNGICVSLRSRIKGRVMGAFAYEAYGRRCDFIDRGKEILKGELSREKGDLRFKLEIGSSRSRRHREIPYPGLENTLNYDNKSLKILVIKKYHKRSRIRLSIQGCSGGGCQGLLLASSMRVYIPRGRITIDLSLARYGSSWGMCVFHFYEQSLKGTNPWRTVSGDGTRLAVLAGSSWGKYRFSISLAPDPSGGVLLGGHVCIDL